MVKKLSNKIILILVIVLVSLITYIGYAKLNNEQETIDYSEIQIETNNEVSKWKAQEELIRNELTRINSLLVLQGEIEVKRTYSTTVDEIDYKGNSSSLQWLSNKLNELKTKEITVQSTYQYNLMYTLDRININNTINGVEVNVHILGLRFLPVSELSDKRVISSETKMLSGEFSVQETSAVMKETSDYTQNLVIHDNKLYYQGLENTKKNIDQLIKNLGIEDVRVNVTD